MKLLFKRSQSTDTTNRAVFKLWAQIEFEGDEAEIVRRYHFENALLIDAMQPGFLRTVAIIGVGAAFVCLAILWSIGGIPWPMLWSLLVGAGAAWLYYDRFRQSIYVRDLVHGRYFDCNSVVELARKEAWLGVVTSFLRQVMESAKQWDGTEILPIEALSKAEAKLVVIRGL